jgi:aldose 1-epimerase
VSSEKAVRPDHPPSGEQHEIRHGDQVVVVTEVGATLRAYSAGGLDALDGFSVDEPSSAGRGQVLAPWPNRLDGGRYEFDGRRGAAAIDEPELGNAIHGLVRWLPWLLDSKTDDAVALGCVLHPQPAYPWRLELGLEYRLVGDGLEVLARATNASAEAAPLGIGFHPYLTVGIPVDEMRLTIPASRRLTTDDRALPVGEADVAGTEFDFTVGRPSAPCGSTPVSPASLVSRTAGRAPGSSRPTANASSRSGRTRRSATSRSTRGTRSSRPPGGGTPSRSNR